MSFMKQLEWPVYTLVRVIEVVLHPVNEVKR